MSATGKPSRASVPRESEDAVREAWDAEAMARAEALERVDADGDPADGTLADRTLDGDVAVAALLAKLRGADGSGGRSGD